VVIRDAMKNIRLLGRMSLYLLRISLRYPVNFVADFIELSFWILVFYFPVILFLPQQAMEGSASPVLYTLWGFFIFMLISDTIWSIAGGLRYDQMTGILEQNFLAPINEFIYPLARLFRIFIRDIPILIAFPIIFWAITGFFLIKNLALAMYILAVSLMGFIGFGYLYAGLVLTMKRSAMSANVIQFLIMIFSAVFYPFKALPEPMLTISKLLPFSYYIDLFRTTIIGTQPELITEPMNILGITLSPFIAELILIHIFTAIFLAIGAITYEKMLIKAKREGTLHTY